MIDTQAIRSKILDLAMRGKLTEQLPEDGTAEELYRQIQAEKQNLIKAGKIKKEKPLPEIADDEIPFEIPANWKWIALGNITSKISSGNTPSGGKKSDVYVPNGFPLFREQNIYDDGIRQAGLVFISEKLLNTRRNCTVKAKDILLNITGGSIGRCALVPDDFDKGSINQHILIIRPVEPEIRFYIHMLICGPYIQSHIKSNAVGDKDGFSGGRCKRIFVPLPPLAEQHRIVARIEQAFSALDTIDALQAKYADNLAVLKSKLIDAAIQGKLTEQLPEDGTAEELYRQIQAEKQALIKAGKIKKEKPLPEITADEVPFEIPKSWKWVRLSNICNRIEAGGDKPQDFVKIKDCEHKIPVVANGVRNDGIIGYTATATAPANTITVAGRGTIGFPCYRNYDYCPVVRLIVIMQSALISPLYLYFVFRGLPADSVGSSIPQLTVPMVNPKIIPLPPLAEQKRIVAKLEEVLEMIGQTPPRALWEKNSSAPQGVGMEKETQDYSPQGDAYEL